MSKKALCWIRRDLRLHDHAALSAALKENDVVYLAFVFDNDILDPLKTRAPSDKRVQFIAESLIEIQAAVRKHGSTVFIRYGNPIQEIPAIMQEYAIDTLYFNRDYSTYPRKRDATVTQILKDMGRKVKDYKDHVMVEPSELLNNMEKPYHVFTPYSYAWHKKLAQIGYTTHPVSHLERLAKLSEKSPADHLESLLAFAGFTHTTSYAKGGSTEGLQHLENFQSWISDYAEARDFPALDHTSKLSVYIRHGCISIRDMVALAHSQDQTGHHKWLTELIWREFYQMIFFHYPEVHTTPFQKKFANLKFPTSEEYLASWKNGQTGFPLIDAAMRCLNQTGWMHNRLRMIVASFLSKTLLVDWKRGERYFSWKLLDYELASNNGGWQWAVGIGCDAAPYFRIFNPTLQSQKYDPNGTFIKTYCPELGPLPTQHIHAPADAKQLPSGFTLGVHYPRPIVNYKIQRQKALVLYSEAKQHVDVGITP